MKVRNRYSDLGTYLPKDGTTETSKKRNAMTNNSKNILRALGGL